MYTGIYIYLILLFVMWIVTVNTVRVYLQRNTRASGEYAYYIEFKLLSYDSGVIFGESRQHLKYTLIDNARKWEGFVRAHLGKWARLDYDVVYRGHLLLSMTSEIRNISIIEN